MKTIWLLALLIFGLVPLCGQGRLKGSILVNVTGENGQPLSGAVGNLTAETYSRSFVASNKGAIRFASLVPGIYALRITFRGMNTYVRPGLVIDTGQNMKLNVIMLPATQEEEIIVRAESPLMDATKMGSSTILTEEELTAIPQARDPWSVVMTVPGVQTDRINVGGSEAGQQSRFASKGDTGANTTWVMDGIEFVDPAARGATQSYLDFSSFSQIGVTTGGADVSQRSGGAVLNFVTKQGSNNHQGSVRLLYANHDYGSSANQHNDVTGQQVLRNALDKTFEKTFETGGPLIKDRLWYWGSFSENAITQLVPNAAGSFQEDETDLRNISVKIHGDLTTNMRFNAFYTRGDKIKRGRGSSITRPRNTTWNQSGPTPIYKFELSRLFGQDTEISVLYARVKGNFQLEPLGDNSTQIGLDLSTGIWEDTTFFNYETNRPVRQHEIKGNTFIATNKTSHELAYGFQYKEATVSSVTTYGRDSLVRFLNPTWIANERIHGVNLYREGDRNTDLSFLSASLQDTATVGNWTFKGGLRYDRQEGNNTPSSVIANPFVPDLLPSESSPTQPAPFVWNSIAPRLGMSYSWGEKSQFLIKASMARYFDSLGSGFITSTLTTIPKYSYHYWYDENGNFNVDPGELDSAVAENVNQVPDVINPDLKPPRVDEVILGFDWAVTPQFTVSISSTIRRRSDLIWTSPNAPFGIEHFSPITQTISAENNRLTGQDIELTYYEINVAGLALINDSNGDGIVNSEDLNNITTNRPDYSEDYRDIEIHATKRLSNRWMMRANLVFMDWTRNVGPNALVDPANLQDGSNENGGQRGVQAALSGSRSNVFFGSSRWTANLSGLYQLPYDLHFSANMTMREGYAFPFAARYRYNDIRGQNNVYIKLHDFDAKRGDDILMGDFKLTRTFHLGGRARAEISLELFNVGDDNAVLARELQVFDAPAEDLTGNRTNHPVEWLSPRLTRLSVAVFF